MGPASSYVLTEAQRDLYLKLANLALPRHTSYPAANFWQDGVGEAFLQNFLEDRFSLQSAGSTVDPVSFYLHIPFCSQLCFYCGCNKYIVPRDDSRSPEFAARLLAGLEAEIDRLHGVIGSQPFSQLHLGGGTPTWLAPRELERILTKLHKKFQVTDDLQASVELDPRVTTVDHLKVFRDFGFSRVSLGVQDFNEQVQEAVNRPQSFQLVADFADECRRHGFENINFDLIYGLPLQTIEGMQKTIAATLSLRPTRIAFYRMAMIPEIFKWQRRFGPEALPDSRACLDMNLHAINSFRSNGYEFIGLDHFALASDPLFAAMATGSINRNFQGMTTGRGTSIVGIGPSAISQWPEGFTQNHSDFFRWEKAIQAGFATERGYRLKGDDLLRRELLLDLYCTKTISPRKLAPHLGVEPEQAGQAFDLHFCKELAILAGETWRELVTKQDSDWVLTRPLGELLVRVVAAVFDRHLPEHALTSGMAGAASRVG